MIIVCCSPADPSPTTDAGAAFCGCQLRLHQTASTRRAVSGSRFGRSSIGRCPGRTLWHCHLQLGSCHVWNITFVRLDGNTALGTAYVGSDGEKSISDSIPLIRSHALLPVLHVCHFCIHISCTCTSHHRKKYWLTLRL